MSETDDKPTDDKKPDINNKSCWVALLAVCIAIVIAAAICGIRTDREANQFSGPAEEEALLELARMVSTCVWASPELQTQFSNALAMVNTQAEFAAALVMAVQAGTATREALSDIAVMCAAGHYR